MGRFERKYFRIIQLLVRSRMFPKTISSQDWMLLISVCCTVSLLLIISITITCVLCSRRIRSNKVEWYNVQQHALITKDDPEEATKIKGSVDIDFIVKIYSK